MIRIVLLVLCLILSASSAQAETYAAWLAGFQARAVATGLDRNFVASSMNGLRLEPSIIALDNKQPEGHVTLTEYVGKTLKPGRIQNGRRLLKQYETILKQIETVFGIPPAIIIALWGKETDFGGFTGTTRTISALATLAYEGRRRDFFETELIDALRVMRYRGLTPETMRGSWAGAVGQCQFMPSNYMRYGVDGNKNGRIDLWNEMADVFPSMANMLVTEGWQRGNSWGQKIKIPTGFDKTLIGRDKDAHAYSFWEQRNVRFEHPVPATARPHIRLYQPDGVNGPAYAIYENFDVLMRWNRSGYFAVAIGRLADEIAAAR